MNITLITLIGGLVLGAIRVFFWFRGRDDAKKDIELEQKTEVLDELEKKRIRDRIIDGSGHIRKRLRDKYSANKD